MAGFLTHSMPRQQGATLIEVLVSLLILAIGLLGMSGLQTVSLRNTQSAYLRTQASLNSNDIVERIRANLQGVEAGSYDGAAGAVTASCNTTAGCTPAQLAANDIAEWKAALAADLPSGAGTVCADSTPEDGTAAASACDGLGTLYAVKIWWDEDRDGNAEKRFTLSFQP
ncbi:MAG: type IV pilus modification protein PilV [Pseudomonadales bacterium]|nr:type IV pilus modification protein PilV [Pseudomonadales bacterium]MCP5343291.1 type IV pilus modification protein PilV [Pseudomonadales bacterium]